MRLFVVSVLVSGAVVIPATTAGATGLVWRPCDGSPLECSTLSVPLDYREPNAAKIDIAVSRKRSADPAARRGVLLLNPGGPGASGRGMPLRIGEWAPMGLTDAHDLIGFDPRGTGNSTPNSCRLDDGQLEQTKMLTYPADGGSGIAESVAYAREVAKRCFEHAVDRLPYITTANTARDMVRIRLALGERKISYFGVSGGAYLGAVYTTMFPHQSDRFVLDSVVDPRGVWRGQWRHRGPSGEENFDDFATRAARRHSTYGLGATREAVSDTYLTLADKLDTQSVKEMTGNGLRGFARYGLYGTADYPRPAEVLQAARPGLSRTTCSPRSSWPRSSVSCAATLRTRATSRCTRPRCWPTRRSTRRPTGCRRTSRRARSGPSRSSRPSRSPTVARATCC
ncbi:alpha/beta fold hydrolase [Kibdelosporangium phytohabitans]|uniref:AB hydrolase-1 domain-containing protein n=1 Tax=Kibdelosporangium phytohabitans TaxID=860235 RepID=A0A0N9HW62_9PSEU|nr:alpha/beta fold hydrolase [Kibdelosporangium phytohabitans]ALG07755.1 hypothetical protein AOZ06_13305 [Kibdelosporangium phytohabitans]MBE1471333.1 pimeloyl-ACP methyl ester carboxylesterase [Kibdelosporangium phytohabitans]